MCVGSNHSAADVPAELEGAPSRSCLCMCILEMDFCGNVNIFHSCSTLVGERFLVGLTWGLFGEGFVEALSVTENCIRWALFFAVAQMTGINAKQSKALVQDDLLISSNINVRF